MIPSVHFGNDAFDFTVFVNYKGGAVDAVVTAAHEFFRPPNTVSQCHSVVFVGEQTERQLVFFLELDVFFDRIGAYAQNLVTFGLKRTVTVAQAAGFGSTPGRIVFRVKIKHEFFSFVVGQGHGLSFFIGGREIGSGIAFVQVEHIDFELLIY